MEMINFWQQLDKPIFILAPMFGVTNVVFRQMIAETAPADLYFTEFVSVDAINSAGFEHVKGLLDFTEEQRPIVAQIWGRDLINFEKAAEKIVQMGFDGIDLNMGCPDHTVLDMGVCAGLINDPQRAKEIIEATRAGAGGLPVSVKTRIGIDKIQTEEWISFLLGLDLPAITIHGRTVADMSAVPARWEEIEKAVALRDQINKETLIIGNGDVSGYLDGMRRVQESGVDGVMIGRGIFQDLFAFERVTDLSEKKEIPLPEKIELLRKHLRMHATYFRSRREFQSFKRLFKMYINQYPNISRLREQLMKADTVGEIEDLLDQFLEKEYE